MPSPNLPHSPTPAPCKVTTTAETPPRFYRGEQAPGSPQALLQELASLSSVIRNHSLPLLELSEDTFHPRLSQHFLGLADSGLPPQRRTTELGGGEGAGSPSRLQLLGAELKATCLHPPPPGDTPLNLQFFSIKWDSTMPGL